MKIFVSGVKMLGPLRNCHQVKHLNYAAVALTNTNLGQVFNGLATRSYSDGKGQGCCKDVVQTTGMKVEPWPKPDNSPQPWRAECPQVPQPPNYDPYRIKVPDTVVPPLPPSNVKWSGVLNVSSDDQDQQDQAAWQKSHGGYHPHHGYQAHHQAYQEEEPKAPGFFGRIKGFFDKLRGKGKEGEGDYMTGSRNINLLYRYPNST